MAPPQLLDGLVRRPGQLERDVQAAAPLRARANGGVEGNPGACGVADDGHLLLAGHEQLALADVEADVFSFVPSEREREMCAFVLSWVGVAVGVRLSMLSVRETEER